ncbi:MAG: type I DNA topoisomerase, partial [Candidatus Promineifilaceae bacterium]
MLVEYFPNILSVEFTSQIEGELDEIAEGKEAWPKVIDAFYKPFRDRLAIADEKLPKVNLNAEPDFVGRKCPTCEEGQLVYRMGRYGKFVGCQNFPTCRHTEQILVKTGVTCPVGGGELIEKKTKKGRVFYGCTRYPDCDWTSWKKPVKVDGSQIVVEQKKETFVPTECGIKVEAPDSAEMQPA